jgi:hypothetical protein
MDPIVAAVREMLDECCADMRIAVNGLDPAILEKQPAEDASSLAVLVRHADTSTRYLLGLAAAGRGDRDRYRGEVRPASFENVASTDEALIGIIDALEEDARRLIASVPLDLLGEHVVFESSSEQGPTRAWALLHAIEHFREHVGHAQLTRQVLAG